MTQRPDRVPADEVRRRMLAAGRELALEAGAALTIEHLRLEEVIQRARVPRSSAYRVWPYREDYIDDLLCHLADAGSLFSGRPVFDPETFSIVKRLIGAHQDLLATPEGRRALFCEVVRAAAAANYAALTTSAPWRLHMALIATLGSSRSPAARQRIAATLEDAQLRSRDSIVALLGYVAASLGVRLRDPAYTFDHVQLAGGLLVQSMALRNVQVQAALEGDEVDEAALAAPSEVNRLLNGTVPGPGLDGQADWPLVARAYLGVLDTFLELDPDFIPPSG